MEEKYREISQFNRRQIVRLLLNYFKGEKNAEQQDDLDHWLEDAGQNRTLFNRLNDENYVQKGIQEFQRYDSAEGLSKVRNRILVRRRARRYMWASAACVMIILGAGMNIWFMPWEQKDVTLGTTIVQNGVRPGSSKAILTLESGKTVELCAGEGLVKGMDGEIFVNDGEKLTYADTVTGKTEIHTLQVPRGGEYTLCLSDGTTIMLNADSRIQYPDRFTGGERVVVLEGEAFFKVAKDSLHPFVVKVDGSRIRVLGTSFNVKSYKDEQQQTTLVEGAVEVSADKQQVILTPGEQAFQEGGRLKVQRVDVFPYIAWTQQRLYFDNESLEQVLRKLERWYNIEIEIGDASVRDIRFTADLPRYEEVSKVLDLIQLTARVKFEWDQRVLKVKKE